MVHALDSVLSPPNGTLLDVLSATPSLSSFLALVQATGQAGLLSQPSPPITVFAPINPYLDALRAERPWLFSTPEATADLVRYHLSSPGLWFSRWLGQGQRLPTLALGGSAMLLVNTSTTSSAAGGEGGVSVRVNNMSAVALDVTATNGVLHTIAGVLVPDLMQVREGAGSRQSPGDQHRAHTETCPWMWLMQIAYASAGLTETVSRIQQIPTLQVRAA